MTDREVRRKLLLIHPPDEIGAERRAWALVRTAFTEREPVKRSRNLVRPVLVIAFVLALIGAVVNPPVLEAIRNALGKDREKTVFRQALFSLPTGGRLLVNSERGPWVVKPGGGRRLLGSYRDASWSPHGLFVTALGPHEVVALEPNGNVRWKLARTGKLASPRWSQEVAGSTRIAYLRSGTLRVVAGNDTGDRLLSPSAARVAPAWRPGASFVLAYVPPNGQVRVVDADSEQLLWHSGALPSPLALTWSADSTKLLALLPHSVVVFGREGKRLGAARLPARAVTAAFKPGSHRFGVVVHYDGAQRSAVVVLGADDLRVKPRLVFAADGNFTDLAWSPDGRWALIGWPSADAFMFVGPGGEQKLVAPIGNQFSSGQPASAGFPAVPDAGWCCPPGSG
jgi:hypothetical protein